MEKERHRPMTMADYHAAPDCAGCDKLKKMLTASQRALRVAIKEQGVQFKLRAAERERCAKRCDDEAERIKHTSHKDGLGMGDSARESVCHVLATAIRKGE